MALSFPVPAQPAACDIKPKLRLAASLALLALLTSWPARAQDSVTAIPEDALRAGGTPVPPPPAGAGLPEIEPVISDEEFNATIPALTPGDDPELDRPLESIEQWERDHWRGSPAEAALPSDATVRPPGVLVAGGSLASDPELAAPLPPVGEFVLAPPEDPARTDDDPPDLRYRVEINGLVEADRQTDARLRRQFDRFSVLRAGDGKAAGVAMLAQRLREDRDLLRRLLAAEGWYGADVNGRIERSGDEPDARHVARLDVVAGARYSLSDVVVEAAPTEPAGLIGQALALRPGEPITADAILAAEARVALALPQQGYPFATLGERDILLDRDRAEGVYTLPVDVGARARFGGFAVSGRTAIDARHASVIARFRRGDLYDVRQLDDLRKALVATGLFSAVSAEPQHSGEFAGDGTEYVTIMVNQDAGPARTIAGTAGYGTGEGYRLEASWTHRNLFRPEGALIVRGLVGTKEQGAGVTFRRSNAGRRDRIFELSAEALHSNFEAFDAYTGRLAGRIAYDSTPLWQKRLTWALGVELLASDEKDFDFLAAERKRRTFYIAGLQGQIGIDHSNDLLDPTNGFRITGVLQPQASFDGGFNPYLRARLDASAYFPVGDGLVLAGRLRLGAIQGADRADIAPSQRFYAGGGGSVRGFAYKSLGPRDPVDDPLGGRSINEASAEIRYRFGSFGVVGFVDAGQSYASSLPRFSRLRYGAGLGGRYYTALGPVRIDIATPISRKSGEGRFNLYVSIGQAF